MDIILDELKQELKRTQEKSFQIRGGILANDGTESSFTSLWQSILNTEVSRAFFTSLGSTIKLVESMHNVDESIIVCFIRRTL